MIVELVGPPGAGKTALVPAVVASLSECTGIRVLDANDAIDRHLARTWLGRLPVRVLGRRPRRRRALLVDLPFGTGFMLSHPRLTMEVLRAILNSPVGWNHRRILLMRWVGVAARQRFLRPRLESEAAVFDEGLYHRSVNLFAWRHGLGISPTASATLRFERDLERYLRLVPAPDLGIFVDADPAILDARVAQRGVPLRLRDRPPERVAEFLASAGRVARAVAHHAADFAPLVAVDNSTTLDEATRQLSAGLALVMRAPASIPPRWPTEPDAAVPLVRRPDRSRRSRRRRLEADESEELARVVATFGLGSVRAARSIGAGRSWTVVADTDAGRVVVKRYKRTVDPTAITSEHLTLETLRRLDVPAPRLVAGNDGETCARLADHAFAVFEYIDGHVPMHELVGRRSVRRRRTAQAARALALLHDALADEGGSVHPSNGLGSDHRRAQPSEGLSAQLLEAHLRIPILATEAAEQADRLMSLDGQLAAAALRATIVHGDYGPYNLLVKRGSALVVVDFELARPDWRLLDVVTAAPRFADSRIGFSMDRFTAFLDGYAAVDPAIRGELRHAGPLIEFLDLRRAAVCLSRSATDEGATWLREARSRLRAAAAVREGRHRLAQAFEAIAR